MNCPQCDYDSIPAGARACPRCGAALPEPSKPSAQIIVEQDIDSVEGGEVTGVEVGQVTGNVTVTYFAATEIKPPSQEEIARYLEAALEAGSGDARPTDDALRRLWDVPFHVRPPGQVTGARRELDEAVQELFGEAKRMRRVQRVVILADAGLGKTPSLRYLMTKAAGRSLRNYRSYQTRVKKSKDARLRTFTVPLFIPLADLRAGLPFLALVRAAFNRYAPSEITLDAADQLLKRYDCLLLLDGLDEVAFSYSSGDIRAIRQFMDVYPQEQYAISCRTASYQGQLGSMDVLVLDDLTDAEVKQVLGADRYAELNESLRQLARNRATLGMILRLGEAPDLPQSKGQLVQRLVRERLGLDDTAPSELTIDLEMAEGLLEQLAYAMQRDRTYRYGERQLMEVTIDYLDEWHEPYTWREVAQALRKTGVLKRDERRQWRFYDRSTQAYFAAAAVIQEPALLEPILEEASDFWWRETLEILIGLSEDPSDLFFELIDRDALVAAHCLQLAGQPADRPIADALVDALIERMSQERVVGRERVVVLLGQSGHPRAKEALLRVLRREWRSLVILAIARALWVLALKSAARPLDKIEAQLQNSERRAEAVIDLWRAHSAQDGNEAHIETRLVTLMNGPADVRLVNGLAAIALGFIGTDSARKALLDKLVEKDVQEFIAWCGVEALTQINHPEVEAAAIDLYTKERYQAGRWARHRARAIYLLGWVGSRRQAVNILYRAFKDRHPVIRGRAAQSIGRLEPPDARKELEALMEREQDPWVLRKIAEALGKVGTMDSIPILERYLRHEQTKTRWMVREAIAEIRRQYELS